MEEKLLESIVKAATQKDAVDCLKKHINRKEDEKNKHSYVEDFQDKVLAYLQKSDMKADWTKEKKIPGQLVKDSVDIYGTPNGRTCIIEIDTLRHDQLSPKFVSRLALCGLDSPIDYVALLYNSTQKSGKPSSEKFIRYMYSILKAINKDSSLIGLYIDESSGNYEIWDCEKVGFTVNGKPCESMNECARVAVSKYIEKKTKIKYEKLCEIFGQGIKYVKDEAGKSRHIAIDKVVDGHPIYVYSQFRQKGSQSNWYKFVELCATLNIKIETSYRSYKNEKDEDDGDDEVSKISRMQDMRDDYHHDNDNSSDDHDMADDRD